MSEEATSQLTSDSEPSVQQDSAQLNQQEPVQQVQPKKKQRNTFLTILVWTLVIIVIIILGLVISAYIAPEFNGNVFKMIDWIISQL